MTRWSRFGQGILLCLLTASSFYVAYSRAGEAPEVEKEPLTEEEKKKLEEEKKKKIKPFKYSAWCAFRDISVLSLPTPKPDLETDQTRLGTIQWDGFGRRGQWATIVLELKNTTEDVDFAGSGRIVLNPLKESEQTGQIPYRTTYRQDFEVGRQSEKQYRFSVLCPEQAFNEPIAIEITANGRTYEPRLVRLVDLEGQDFIVVVSESSGAFRHLATKAKLNAPDEFEEDSGKERPRKVAVVEPAELPTRWHDLMLANLIVIDGPPREKLSAAQWSALKSYAQAGGHILITAGKDPSRLKGEIEELAGITVREMVEVEGLDTFSDSLVGSKPEWRLPLVDVKVNAETKSASIPGYNRKTGFVEQCRRHYGAGSVTFLPFSLSDKLLEHWPGRTQIALSIIENSRNRSVFTMERPEPETQTVRNYWGGVTQEGLVIRPETMTGLRHSLDESFSKDTPVQLQKPPMVMSFILLYLLCAVPGNYFIFGWFKRREIAWLAVPFWALSFVIIAYVVGYMGSVGKLTVNEVSVLEAGPGQSEGIAHTFVGLYAPRRDEYRVHFGKTKGLDPQSAPGHLINVSVMESRNLDLPEISLVDSDAGLNIEKLRVQQRATRRLEVVHRVDLQNGIDVAARENAGMINVFDLIDVKNNTGFDLYYPVFISQGRAIELSPSDVLRPNEGVKLENVGGADGPSWKDTNSLFFGRNITFRTVRGPHAANRVDAINKYIRERVEKFQGGVVCAWIEGPVLPVEVAGSGADLEKPGQFEGLTLLLAPVPIKKDGDRSFDGTRRYRVRYALKFDQDTGQAQWKETAERTAPMAMLSDGNVTHLELEVPNDYRTLQENRMQLMLNCRLAVADKRLLNGKIVEQHTLAPFNGELKVEVKKTLDNGTQQWIEAVPSQIFPTLEKGVPYKIPTINFSLDDHRIRKDNVIQVRVTARYQAPQQKKYVLELQRVELKAGKK